MYFDAISLHRVAHALWRRRIPVIPKLIDGAILLLFNSAVHHRTRIGPRTMAGHRGIGVVIHRDAVVGADVWFGPHVVLGARRGDEGAPTIEDGVVLGANSVVLGAVRIGAGAIIAAGAVVLDDVAPGDRVGGNPARTLKRPA
jgi:serine O-acetyltransferase